jgi:hypothetical protein
MKLGCRLYYRIRLASRYTIGLPVDFSIIAEYSDKWEAEIDQIFEVLERHPLAFRSVDVHDISKFSDSLLGKLDKLKCSQMTQLYLNSIGINASEFPREPSTSTSQIYFVSRSRCSLMPKFSGNVHALIFKVSSWSSSRLNTRIYWSLY